MGLAPVGRFVTTDERSAGGRVGCERVVQDGVGWVLTRDILPNGRPVE